MNDLELYIRIHVTQSANIKRIHLEGFYFAIDHFPVWYLHCRMRMAKHHQSIPPYRNFCTLGKSGVQAQPGEKGRERKSYT